MSKDQIMRSKGHYVNGEWIDGLGEVFESNNPAYGTILWQGTNATEVEIKQAADAARQALDSWSALPFADRTEYVKKFAERIEKQRNELARLISEETGKPLWEAQTEVTAVISKVNLSIQAYQERTWPKENMTTEANACLRFKPQGVVVVLGAFNFPAHLSNGHIVPALLAGNTVLYKPSELTPSVAEFVMRCWHESEIPHGVINCLQGNAVTGSCLLAQDIQGVYFTGSYPTGLRIHQQFNNRPEVILALEMGGNNPLVLAEVADLKAAVYHTLLSTLITSGQRCTCARRVIIPNTAQGDAFLQLLVKAYQAVKVGPYDQEPEPFMGPVIGAIQALKYVQAQNALIGAGAESILRMSVLREGTGLLSPGIVDMTAVSNPSDQEIFAPFIQVHRYQDFDEAIALANQTKYGLAAGLLADDEQQYRHFYQKVRAGLINWNRPTTGAASNLPFGGVGYSGNHRPSAYFAADYCSYPIASMEQPLLATPSQMLPGIVLED